MMQPPKYSWYYLLIIILFSLVIVSFLPSQKNNTAFAESPLPTPTPHAYYFPIISRGLQTSIPIVIQTPADRDNLGLTYWPDGNIGFVSPDKFYAAGNSGSMLTTGTVNDPAQTKRRVIMHTNQIFNYMGGGPVYVTQSGVMVLFYHAEVYLDGYENFHSSLGTAASWDGINFYDTGTIITAGYNGIVEMCGAPFAVNGEYIYVYFKDKLSDGTNINLAVARAPIADFDHWSGQWQKYYQGGFTQPGLGGVSSSLGTGNKYNRWMDIERVGDKYYMALTDASAIYLLRSNDGINWGNATEIIRSNNELFYPSAIYHNDRFYVFYTDSALGGFQRWQDAKLMRVELVNWQ
jgi:hypothetical protein